MTQNCRGEIIPLISGNTYVFGRRHGALKRWSPVRPRNGPFVIAARSGTSESFTLLRAFHEATGVGARSDPALGNARPSRSTATRASGSRSRLARRPGLQGRNHDGQTRPLRTEPTAAMPASAHSLRAATVGFLYTS